MRVNTELRRPSAPCGGTEARTAILRHARASSGRAALAVWLALVVCGVALPRIAAGEADMMRIFAAIRLPAEPGEDTVRAAKRARATLDLSAKEGFNHAIWAVSRLPAKKDDYAPWLDACREAFPFKPILALDAAPDAGDLDPQSQGMRTFLELALPRVHSILINYTGLDNYSCRDRLDDAIARVRRCSVLAREVSPRTFQWLLIGDAWTTDAEFPDLSPPQDDSAREASVRAWREALGSACDGFMLYRLHPCSVPRCPPGIVCREETALLQTGKPVVRAGLLLPPPRLRRGIEQEVAQRHERAVKSYEDWVAARKYAGYARNFGGDAPLETVEQPERKTEESQ